MTSPADSDILAQLDALFAALKAHPDPRRASTEWKQVFNLLKKTGLDANKVANVVAMRGVEPLAGLLDSLRAPAAPPPGVSADAPADGQCQAAIKAFKKRLKLTRLDDESRLERRDPLSKGERSGVAAIQPPDGWPQAVWDELVRRGRLKPAGKGFYELLGD